MLELIESSFSKITACTLSIEKELFTEDNIRCFDNDGFELTLLEQNFYTQNNFFIKDYLNHNCLQSKWLEINEEKNFVLDHALLLERKSFEGASREQLKEYVSKFPQLKKYLLVVPKWGIDFALEFYDNDHYMEVLHIEYDYHSYAIAQEAKLAFEQKLLSTDWNDFVCSLKNKKDKWSGLKGFDQNNWKAAFWGLPKAEITFKSFFV